MEDTPVDIWLEIAKLSHPRDVLSLSHSCHALYARIETKEIWGRVLKSVCRDHMLFLPSFPLDMMDLGQIKYAALGPYRWTKRLQSLVELTEDDLSAGVISQNAPASYLPMVPPLHLYAVKSRTTVSRQRRFLVPGGRFLIGVDVCSLLTIRLLDLGIPGSPVLGRPRLVSIVELRKPQMQISHLTVVPVDDRRLRIAVLADDGDLIVRVLEISPAEEDPVFEEVACLHLKMNCEFTDEISLHRSSVVMQIRVSGSRMALIWDFVKRRYMIWKMGFAYGLILVDNVALQVDEHGFSAWPITSEWSPLPSPAALPIPFEQLRITPSLQDELSTTPFRHDFESRTPTATLKSDNWYRSLCKRLTLDVIQPTEDRIRWKRGHRYEIEACQGPPYVRLKTTATFTFSPPYSFSIGSTNLGFSSGFWIHLQSGLIRSQKCPFSVLGTDKQDQQDLETDPGTTITIAMSNYDRQQSLCTRSGRMVSSTEYVGEINVADYLSYHPTTCPLTPSDLELQQLRRDLGISDFAL